MRKFLVTLLISALVAMPANAGPTNTWGGSTTAQFFPTIIKALLGNGYSLVPSQVHFGDCSDGNVTISAGTTTLARDMFYNNLTINGTGAINTQNQRIFVCGTLDLSGAPAFAINSNGGGGGNGGNGGGTGGAGANVAAGTNLTGRAGGAGGAGGTAAGSQGAAGTGGNVITSSAGAASGAGGTGASGAGGAARGAAAVTAFPMRDIIFNWFLPQTGAGGQVFTAGSGSGGSGGGGDTTNSGAGGGGGGASGQTIYLAANIIKTDGSTAGSAITAWGGPGGNGGAPTVGNTGGGGGGGGGSGGWIVVKYNKRTGPVVTLLVTTFGGNAFGTTGLGGAGHGTGTAGGNGAVGGNGLIQTLDVSTGQSASNTGAGINL